MAQVGSGQAIPKPFKKLFVPVNGIQAATVSSIQAYVVSHNIPQASGEEGLPQLVEELLRALEDVGGRALGAAALEAGFARAAGGDRREALQEHVDPLMTVRGQGIILTGALVYLCVGIYACIVVKVLLRMSHGAAGDENQYIYI